MTSVESAALGSIAWWLGSMVVVVGGVKLAEVWWARAKARRVNRMLGRAGVLAGLRTPKPYIPQQRGGERRAR